MTATPCNMIATCAALILVSSSAVAADNPTAGDQWERALLDAKKRGDLPGPKPGQRCLWSAKLGAALSDKSKRGCEGCWSEAFRLRADATRPGRQNGSV